VDNRTSSKRISAKPSPRLASLKQFRKDECTKNVGSSQWPNRNAGGMSPPPLAVAPLQLFQSSTPSHRANPLYRPFIFMLSRLNLLSRHLSRTFGSSRPTSPTLSSLVRPGLAAMTSAHPNFTKPIHTAACLIIGDEVLGGKVRTISVRYRVYALTFPHPDNRHQFTLPSQVLLQPRHPAEARRGHPR